MNKTVNSSPNEAKKKKKENLNKCNLTDKHYSMKANYFCEEHEYDITAVCVKGVDHFLVQRDQLCRRGIWGEVW